MQQGPCRGKKKKKGIFSYLIVIFEEMADFPVKIILIDCLLFKDMLVLSSDALFILKLLATIKENLRDSFSWEISFNRYLFSIYVEKL